MSDDSSAQLRRAVAAVLRRKTSVLAITAVVFVSAVVYSSQPETRIYRSRAEVLIRTTATGEQQSGFLNLEVERRLAASTSVRDIALKRAGDRPLGAISVAARQNANTLVFASTSADREVARRTAQAYSEAYLEFRRTQALDDITAASKPLTARIRTIDNQIEVVQRRIFLEPDPSDRALLQIRLNSLLSQKAFLEQRLNDLILPENLRVGTLIQPAGPAALVAGRDRSRTLLLAVLFGLVLGIAVALVRDRLDDRVRSTDELEVHSGAPVLASVPRCTPRPRHDRDLLVTVSKPESDTAEGFRILRTGVTVMMARAGARVLLVTSPQAGEGKTTVTANLGLSLATAGKSVIMVSADLRRPRLARVFGRDDRVGLAHVLRGEARLIDAIGTLAPKNLRLLAAGSSADGDDLFESQAMKSVMRELHLLADVVLIDAPPILPVADAQTLAPLADGVLLVVDADQARPGAIAEARHKLDQVGAKVLGAVLNKHDRSRFDYGYYDYYRAESRGNGRAGHAAVQSGGAHGRWQA